MSLLKLKYGNFLRTSTTFFLEFFWKDYTGLIPSEALPGGIDKTGNKTYIAQLSIVAEYNYQSSNIHTLPATLLRGARSAEAAYRARTVYSNETTNTKVPIRLRLLFSLNFLFA